MSISKVAGILQLLNDFVVDEGLGDAGELHEAGVAVQQVIRLADEAPDQAEFLSAAERAMLAYAARAATTPYRVTAGEVAGLKAHGFSDEEIFDIAALATARAFFSGVVEALGGEADATFLELDERLRSLDGIDFFDFDPAVQHVFPEQVTADVQRHVRALMPGGGYVFAPVHNIQANVPIENVLAMLEVIEELR